MTDQGAPVYAAPQGQAAPMQYGSAPMQQGYPQQQYAPQGYVPQQQGYPGGQPQYAAAPAGYAGQPTYQAGYQPPQFQPSASAQPQFQQPAMAAPMPAVMVAQPMAGGGCSAGQHAIVEDFTCCGICLGICFFPIGLLCCFAMKERRCINCQMRFA